MTQHPLADFSVFGPREGYSPQIGFLVSQLDWMRRCVLLRLHDLTPAQLDWLPTHEGKPDGNSIGMLLLHLAATERYYQVHTLQGRPWADVPPELRQRFGPVMRLGALGRERIRGHDLAFYLDTLAEVRAHTLATLRERDDAWLLAVDQAWVWGPANNLCKWFHVCEHESHHTGQIDLHLKHLRPLVPPT